VSSRTCTLLNLVPCVPSTLSLPHHSRLPQNVSGRGGAGNIAHAHGAAPASSLPPREPSRSTSRACANPSATAPSCTCTTPQRTTPSRSPRACAQSWRVGANVHYSIGHGTAVNLRSLPKPGVEAVLPLHALHTAYSHGRRSVGKISVRRACPVPTAPPAALAPRTLMRAVPTLDAHVACARMQTGQALPGAHWFLPSRNCCGT
jgi:hypothetical protein